MKLTGLYSPSRRDFCSILFRHKWKIHICFLLVMAAAILVTAGTLRVYQADAKLLIRIGRESVTLDPTATTGQTIGVGRSRETEINSELEILKSWDLSQQVVESIGPEAFLKPPEDPPPSGLYLFSRKLVEMKDKLFGFIPRLLYPPNSSKSPKREGPVDNREAATNVLKSGLKISVQKNSDILNLIYEGSSPSFSRAVLEKLIALYMEKHIKIYRTSGSYSFFDQQTQELRQQLAGVEEELRRLKNKTGVASIDDHRRFLLNRINTAQQEFEVTQAALAASAGKMESFQKDLAKFPNFVVTTESEGTSFYGADNMRTRLYELQLKEQELLSKYPESNVLVQDTRRQIVEARKLQEREKQDPSKTQNITRGINSIHQTLNLGLHTEKANFASLQSKSRVLQDQLNATRRELEDLNNTEFRMANLQRELSMQDAKYRRYSENREQARIDQALETNKVSNITIVQPAVAFSDPVRPQPFRNLVLGFFLAIIVGLGVAFFSEFLDHSLKTPQDVEEKLQLQMLASIPLLNRK